MKVEQRAAAQNQPQMTPPANLPVAAKLFPSFDRPPILRLLGTYGTIVVLVVMLVAFALAEPDTFATIGNFRNILNDMAIGTIVAGGLTVPLVAGDFDLSVGYVASFCGLLLVGLLSSNQLPIPVAMLIVIAIGAVIGIINGVIVSKLGVNAFIATLGTGTVVVGMTTPTPAAFPCNSPTLGNSPPSPSAGCGACRISY